MAAKKSSSKSSRARRTSAATREWKVQRAALDELHLDIKNPRLAESPDTATEEEALKILWRDMAVDEIAYSVAENGFFEHEPVFAAKEKGRLVVIEGNRRLAAVKLLCDRELRSKVGATDLPRISASRKRSLATLPVIIAERSELWQFIGFKHVNGPQAWGSFAKAKYITWVHTEVGVSLDQIASQIGDTHDTVKRLHHGVLVLDQAESTGVFDVDDRWKSHFSFSHLYTGLSYPGIQQYLGTSAKSEKKNPVPKGRLKNLGNLCRWLYGSRSLDAQPIIRSQNPDLRILDEVLLNPDATAALTRGMPLKTSHDISKGDETLFREALQLAKKSLQDARGTVLTGFRGDRSELDTATDIVELASELVEDMRASSKRRSRRAKKSARKRAVRKKSARR